MLAVPRVRFAGPMCQSPSLLAIAAIALGLAAHVLGGGAAIDCAPLMLAAALGVATTLFAQRVAGQVYRGAPMAVAMLGAGQLGMHLALSGHEAVDAAADSAFGLNCGLVVTHTLATALLAVLLLGAHQSADLALRLVAHARRHVPVLVASAPPLMPLQASKSTIVARAWDRLSRRSQEWRYGLARPRRGPPALAG